MVEHATTGLELVQARKAAGIKATQMWRTWPCSSNYISLIESKRTVTDTVGARYRAVLAECIRTRSEYETQWAIERRERLAARNAS